MNKTIRNYLLDIALFLLLAIDFASLAGMRAETSSGAATGHIVSSILLTLGCLIHIIWHWSWIQAVLAGRVKGKIKLSMNSMVTAMILLAGFSGFGALATNSMYRFHGAVGSVALLGLFIHSVKHLPWMFAITKKFIIGNSRQKVSSSA